MNKVLNNKKIIIVCGGNSSEKEISIKTGMAINASLQKKFRTELLLLGSNYEVVKNVYKEGDLIFNALHGGYGENGEIQSFFEKEGFCYIGSKSKACKIAINKNKCKNLASSIGIKTPFGKLFNEDFSVFRDFEKPFIVKPNQEGSSIGFFKVNSEKEFLKAIRVNKKITNEILIEEYIEGREITVPIIDQKVLPIVEIKPNNKIYDYESKYVPGKSKYIVPANIDLDIQSKISKNSIDMYSKVGCNSYSRLDFILSKNNTPYFLELNTYPGMTQTSLFPKSALSCGIEFDELILELVAMKSEKQKFQK